MLNRFVQKNIKTIEMIAVVMRIGSFSIVSWLGPQSPFMLVWVINTTDAFALTWCALLKKDAAYTVLNVFWMLIGAIGIIRASGVIH